MYCATSDGKGVVDGAGGNVKQLLCQETMSKEKYRVVVQDAFTFAKKAKKRGKREGSNLREYRRNTALFTR